MQFTILGAHYAFLVLLGFVEPAFHRKFIFILIYIVPLECTMASIYCYCWSIIPDLLLVQA